MFFIAISSSSKKGFQERKSNLSLIFRAKPICQLAQTNPLANHLAYVLENLLIFVITRLDSLNVTELFLPLILANSLNCETVIEFPSGSSSFILEFKYLISLHRSLHHVKYCKSNNQIDKKNKPHPQNGYQNKPHQYKLSNSFYSTLKGLLKSFLSERKFCKLGAINKEALLYTLDGSCN